MQKFWRLFKLPLIATAIGFVVSSIVGIAILASLARAGAVGLEQRSQQLGQGLAVVTIIVLAPFWIYAVLQAGKENREELRRAKSKAKSGTTKKKPKAAR